MTAATAADVETRLGRSLDTTETTQATALLSDVENIIRTRVPDLDSRVSIDEYYRGIVVMVESNAVKRVLQNPDGYRQESEGSYSYSLDIRAAAGFVVILDDEWRWLGAGGNAFTITPGLPAATSTRPLNWWEIEGY